MWKVCIDFEKIVKFKTSETYKNMMKRRRQEERHEANLEYGNFEDSDYGDPDDKHFE